jgi:hypothetical protein
MVYTKKKLFKKKNNSTRKLKGGSVMGKTASFDRSAIDNTKGSISRIAPSKEAVSSTAAGTALGAATFMTVGLATGLPATTFLTAQISTLAMSAIGPLGLGTAAGVASAASLAGPIGAAVGAALFVAYTTYSVSRKERIKKRVKHFIKKQMLDILDKMNEKSKQSKLGETKYPPLKHYDQFQANVKQFFIDYLIFDKLAEIFISMQSSMLHFYPSEKLMLPIHFQQRNEGDPDDGMKLDLNQEPFKKYRVGSNFICFYDYLSTYDYLYFHCDQLNDGNTRQFVRVKLSSRFMTSKTPEEFCKYFKKRLQYVYGAKDSKPTTEELYQAQDLKPEVKKSSTNKVYSFDVPDIPAVEEHTMEVGSLSSDDEFDDELNEENGQRGSGPIGKKMNDVKQGIYSYAEGAVVISYVGLTELFRTNIVDVVTINNNDVKKSSRAISKENTITTNFAKNVMVLMQFPPFVKVISEQIRDFKTSYLQDFQANADTEDDTFIDQSISESVEREREREIEHDNLEMTGGALFGPSMRARKTVIKSSKSKIFQGLRTRKFTEAFYHVFSKTLRVRESEMKKFFGDYLDDLMEMFKKNFSTVINSASIYISIARALAITFEKKLGAAFNVKSLNQQEIMNEQSIENIKGIDQNRESTLNEAGHFQLIHFLI